MRCNVDGGNQLVPAKGEYFVESQPSHTLIDCTLQRDGDSVNDCIWIYYQNVRGLRTKIDELLLATTDCNFDVLIMTETGLDNCINSQQLFGTGFNVFRCDHSPANSNKSRFGGVLIAVAQRYVSRLVNMESGKSLEQICVSSTIKGKKVLLCAIYIPPDQSQDVNVMNAHISSLTEFCEKCSDSDAILVCGDYNQPRIRWCLIDNVIQCDGLHLPLSSSTLVDGMDYLCLGQRNLLRNLLDRTLDLVFCLSDSEADVNSCSAPLLPVDSHHPPLEISLPVCLVSDEPNERHHERPLNFRRIDIAALSDYLITIDWDAFSTINDVDEMAEKFCLIINDWIVSNVPRVRPSISPAWSNLRLRELKRARNACQRKLRRQRTPFNKRNFQQASNVYRNLNTALYKSYVLRVQMSLRRNPRSFWHFVNSKRKRAAIPSNVHLNEFTATSTSESSQLFARHFASIFSKNPASSLEIEEAIRDVPVDCVELGLFIVNPHMVSLAAKKLKCSFVPGPDGLPAVIICRCIAVLSQPLCDIFNRSLQQGIFPRIWKQSFMTPVYKRNDRHNVINYRGITSLSAVSKLFEILVSGVFLNATKSYISTDQHGFMPGRSVTTNLLNFTSKCITSMEDKAQVDVIYTDLKAAFDKIDHKILLQKLSRLGVSTQIVSWLESYLTDRQLRVKIGDSVSLPFSNESGVPQGSNLGPLLFILFFNDAGLVLDKVFKLIYADDLKLYFVVRTIEDCLHLQRSLTLFADWCKRNKLTLSVEKCVVISFHRLANPIVFGYHIDSNDLARVTNVTDLGIKLDSQMNFVLHRSAIISKATRQLGFISKIAKDFADPYCWKSLYCALVRPILENSSVVWHPHQVTWCLRIERIQKRFIRLALKTLPWRDAENLPPYPDRCRLLGLDTLERRRKLQQSLLVAKLLSGETDAPELLAKLSFRVPNRSLRNTTLLQPSFHRTLFGFNEPFSACVRAFTSVEDVFEFNESTRRFVRQVRLML